MYRTIPLVAAAVLVAVVTSHASGGTEITIRETVRFDTQALGIEQTVGYSRISLPDTRNWADEPGLPSLPVRTVRLIIPANARVVELRSGAKGTRRIAGSYRVDPMPIPQQMRSRSSAPLEFEGGHSVSELSDEELRQIQGISPVETPLVVANEEYYKSRASMWPESAVLLHEGMQRGIRFAVVQLHPVDYVPGDGEISVREEIIIECVISDQIAEIPRAGAQRAVLPSDFGFVEDALNIADAEQFYPETMNQEITQASSVPSTQTSSASSSVVKYLVVGNVEGFGSTLSVLQPLIDWKTKKGIPAEAVCLASA